MTGPTPQKPGRTSLEARAAAVRLMIFDVDGVLTDGGLFYGPDGEQFKRFDVKDGHGLVMARLTGVPSAVLTARRSRIVEKRCKELGFVAVLQGRKDKQAGLADLLKKVKVDASHCSYMGDDLNDLAPMARVGLPACPSDAAAEVRQAAVFISRQSGGHGAVRELVELVLKASGRWEQALTLMGSPTLLRP